MMMNSTVNRLETQHKRKEFISIQKLALLKAKDDGIEEGIEKGIIQVAKNLLDVLDDKTIARKTGLSIQDIASLR